MIVDKDGGPVTPIKTVHYSNIVTVQYEDGTQKDVPMNELFSTINRQEFVSAMQAVRVERA